MPKFEEIKEHLKLTAEYLNGIFFYMPNVTAFQQQEISFHDVIHESEEEVHQLNSLRNIYYHNYFKKHLGNLPVSSVILEIGAGSGFDALPFLSMEKLLIVSDISPKSVLGIKQKIEGEYPKFANQVVYLVADGQNLPLNNGSVDAVYIVASLHHFEQQKSALQEMYRVVKPGGLIICAMEPSRFMMGFTKVFKNNSRLRIHQGHSEADETHKGYNKKDWVKLISPLQLSSVSYKRVWLWQGFLHYGLEGVFRLLKLKKRITVPRFIEWIFLIVDEILLTIPIINKLNWHWIVILTKK